MPPYDILLVHAAATWFMTGLIWMVQVVHYPLFAKVGVEGYVDYQRRHMRRITWIVAPAMFAELGTAILLLVFPPGVVDRGWWWVNLATVLVLWLSTAVLQVPAHRRLMGGFDGGAHRRLVATNWLRTIVWTGRGMLVLALLRVVVRGS